MTIHTRLEACLEQLSFEETLIRLYGKEGKDRARTRCMEAAEGFRQTFGYSAQALFSAPGRTELGGNHTDHQRGCVLAAAVDLDILAAAAGAKPLAFLLGDFNSEADVRGEGYDLILRSGWQDTYRLARQRDDGYTVVQAIDGWRDAPDAAAKKRIDQIWCSQAVPVHSSRVVFGGKQEPRVSDHAGVLIEVGR